ALLSPFPVGIPRRGRRILKSPSSPVIVLVATVEEAAADTLPSNGAPLDTAHDSKHAIENA
ncbi:hypothetical protein TSMEX_004536, partial [Taenia solium]